MYDTLACVGNLKRSYEEEDMLSEIEIINKNAAGRYDIGQTKRFKKIFGKR